MIPGELVNLRAIERDDVPMIHQWRNEPVVMRGWGWSASVASLNATAQWVEEWLAIEFAEYRPYRELHRRKGFLHA